MANPSFFSELRRRKVLQSAAIYGAVAWGVTEVLVTVVEQLFLPQWVATLAVIGFVVGFPVAMFLAWTFDLTSEGLRRTDVTSGRGAASIAASLILLVAGTAGLFFLIQPDLQQQQHSNDGHVVMVPNSLVVLPFGNAGLDPDDVWLSDGLSDELRDQLAQVQEIRVAARSSSVAARAQDLNALQISRTLGVTHLVEGNMRRQGNRLKVSVQLIDGTSGLSVWSKSYERGPNELLSIQIEIAELVVQTILPDATLAMAEPATRDATANELMLLARHYELKVRDRKIVDEDTLREAVRLYREATEADPESALAHSRLASTLLYLGDLEAAEAPIFRALSLNPNLSEVQNTLGEYYWARGLPDARNAFARAMELNRNNADALQNFMHAQWLSYAPFPPEIPDLEPLVRRALELDPLSLYRHAALGDFLGKEGRVEKVPAVIQGIEELFDDAASYRVISWLKQLVGEIDEAIAWTIRARDLEPDNPDHIAKLAELYALIGDEAIALRLEPEPSVGLLYLMSRYQELIDAAEIRMIEEPGDMEVRYLLADAYIRTGQFEAAIHVLSSTGLPDTVFNDVVRSVAELRAYISLTIALAAAGQPETVELAQSLATWNEGNRWWGDIAWTSLARACDLSILERHDEALQHLARVKESKRLAWDPIIRDSWCFRTYTDEPVYQDLLQHHEQRKAALRARLPATLAEFGVEL